MTFDDLIQIMPLARSRIPQFVGPLNASMDEFEINRPRRQASYIAQLAHESGQLIYMQELASGEAYDRRENLGNTRLEAIEIAAANGSTPGRWWKGHGPIQITGYDNHKACGEYLGLDLLNFPRLICEPEHGCRAAGWYWHVFKNLNPVADAGDFKAITRAVNGGMNGWAERLAYYERACKVLGVTA